MLKIKNRWVVFVFILLTGMTFAIGQFKVPPTMVASMQDLGIGVTGGGLLMSIVAITAIILAVFSGALTVRFKPRTLLLAAIIFALLGNIIGYVTSSFGVLLFSRLLEGIGYGTLTMAAPTIIAEWFPDEKERKAPMALWTLWVPCGMLIIFNLANVIMAQYNWRTVWLFCAILFVIILILFILFVSEPEGAVIGAGNESAEERSAALKVELKSPCVWSLTLVFTIFGLGCAAYSTFAPTFCVQALNMAMDAANSSTSLMTFGMIAGGFIMTAILGSFKGNLKNLLLVVTIVTGIFFSVSFLLTSPSQVIPFVLVMGVVLQTIPPVVFALVPEAAHSPRTVGVAMGISAAGDHLGAFIGTVALGAIVEGAGENWLAAVPAMVVFALIGVFGAIWFKRSMKKRAQIEAAAPATK